MATGIGPKKSLFKRRAGPVIVQKITEPNPAVNPTSTSTNPSPPPARLTSASSPGLTQDGTAITTDSDSSPPRPAANDPGIDLFRRAKHFYPRAIEASLRTGAKQDGANGHDPKRRRVSSEQDGSGNENDAALSLSSRSPSWSPSPLGRNVIPPVELRDSSKSPSPQTRPDKGKGVATQHTVNAGLVFADASPAKKRASPEAEPGEEAQAATDTNTNTDTNTGDDAVIVLDDSDAGDTQPQKQRPRKDSWEEDDDDDASSNKKHRPRRPQHTAKDDDASGDDGLAEAIDPEFEEYIIRARARDAASRAAREIQDINAQLAARARRSASSEHAGGGGPNDPDKSAGSQATASSTATAAASEPPPRPLSEQSYRIFITPRLPEPVPPLIANVRMDQEMRHVKNAFISHAREKGYEMPPDVAKSVLLTWKGAKIYDFTTGLTLKLSPDAKGRFHGAASLGGLSSFTGGDAGDNGSHRVSSGFVSGGLHIEIWTDELYERYIVEQDKRCRRNMGETVDEDLLSEDEYEGGGDRNRNDSDSPALFKREESMGHRPQPHKTQPTHDKIRLVLASRSYDKLSVTAHSDTTIDTLVQAFRIQRGIAADKTVTVWMDGEQLDGGTTVGDADMEDMDSVEVHIS